MRYAGLIKNDVAAGIGVCVTLFVQGCSIHCPGCHNPEAQDFDGGQEFTELTQQEILEAITANNINRNFCIMGGEPLDPRNYIEVAKLIKTVRYNYPNIKIYLWTGYKYDTYLSQCPDPWLESIFDNIDYLIDGPYIESERDITLHLRGSRNQNVINLTKK